MTEGLFKTTFCIGVPMAAQELMWNVFFKSRGRHLSLGSHFPWINSLDGVYSISIADVGGLSKNKVIATLAMRQKVTENGVRFGLIGLVCVDEKFRGIGLSSLILEAAIQAGLNLNWSALVLWTQKPSVYTNHEFMIDGNELYASVSNESAVVLDCEFDSLFTSQDGDLYSPEGLPGFATALATIRMESFWVSILRTVSGYAIANWGGDDNEVANFLNSKFPKNWEINYLPGDRLIAILIKEKGLSIKAMSGATRMVRKLVNWDFSECRNIRILDRI